MAGCWDERLYKNSSVVSLTGVEGSIGDMTAYYAYPEATSTEMKTIIIIGQGITPRDVRQNAELKVEQTMDLSVLSTVLISEETAENDIYEYFDIYFRDANSPITAKLAVIQGDLKPFFELSENKQSTAGEFYDRYITSLEENSLVIPYTLQTASSILFENAQDLALPYLKMGEDDRPNGDGVALFSGRHFTGKTLKANEGVLLNILNDTLGFSARISYLYKDSPITVRVNKLKRKLNIAEDKIEINLEIQFMVSEFPQDNLDKGNTRKEVEEFLKEKIEHDLNEVINKLQEAKSDALGLGRSVRAFHPEWFKKDWNDHFSKMDISANLDVEIVKTGILD